MKFTPIIIWTVVAIVVLLLLINMEAGSYTDILRSFIPQVEGFQAKPKWDFKQWTWGYGTRVPNSGTNPNVSPGGTITRAQAFDEMMKDLNYRYSYLKPKVKRNLRPGQWAALLSFAFNEGLAAADKLLPQINAGDLSALETHWKQYKYIGSIVSSDLVDRRNKEWQLYIS